MADNTTRQTTGIEIDDESDHLDSGYENFPEEQFWIPGCGIEDSDISLFNLFDKDIGFRDKSVYSADKKITIQKPLVIFATGERFAIAKKLNPPRDKQNKKLLLPAISIRRTSITQTSEDITGRGINQHTGKLIIKRKLDEQDQDYQNFINKLALKNMDLPTTRRTIGELSDNLEIKNGALLTPSVKNNLIEVVTIPQPQFFTATYEVTFWTNYTQHMNYLFETYISSFLPQTRGHKLVTNKGYWFMCYVDDTFGAQENFEEFSLEERIIKYTFNVNVKGYILVPDYETNMVPIRKYISSPIITFESFPNEKPVEKQVIDNQVSEKETKFMLNDLNVSENESQNLTTNKKYLFEKIIIDPKTGKKIKKYVTALDSNQKKGETIYYASNKESLNDLIKTFSS